MSIKQQIEINELKARVEAMEGKVNEMGLDHRKVAGTPDPDVKPAPKKKNAKVEGNK